MPNYKCVLFSDSIHQQYMIDQELAINDALPDVTTEQADYTDSRLALYSTTPTRVPALIVFKDGARMQIKHAKRGHDEIVTWIQSIVGA
jgi:hypothetical protein